MDNETFNLDLRKFLKQVGVTSQREIELAVGRALASGRLDGVGSLPVRMVLTVDGIGLTHEVTGDLSLERESGQPG
ncbi:hypothetical protein VY88_02155 [Azospirillum thiophilum]|uniref:Uncharacterized protein n=1 Tax=Azospirillum thiophilum TaxID=528244 RepID=A0AAC8ZU79_9PROT|nr:DUF6494 family protein [Azospirillum thiophilum]ALG71276.1 hypothetical protein AL072_10555 [Azospirillum thiophilum]KJR65068.1 hypothetical protein VY88_02155 [Azospirillum thiophilum]